VYDSLSDNYLKQLPYIENHLTSTIWCMCVEQYDEGD